MDLPALKPRTIPKGWSLQDGPQNRNACISVFDSLMSISSIWPGGALQLNLPSRASRIKRPS